MKKYLFVVIGLREKETGPGSVDIGDDYEKKGHVFEAKSNAEAMAEAQSILNRYLTRLSSWRWSRVAGTELYAALKAWAPKEVKIT